MLETVATILISESWDVLESAALLLPTLLASPESQSVFLGKLKGADVTARLLGAALQQVSGTTQEAVLGALPLLGAGQMLSLLASGPCVCWIQRQRPVCLMAQR